MCGIFATTRPDLWTSRIDEVLESLSHRGPDGNGSWADPQGSVLLAHTRLAIIGLGPEADQPLASSDGSVHVTYNGEICNYRKVAVDVGLQNPHCDTNVLAEILRDRGVEGLAGLRGMYAFAAWDERRQSLVAARDPYGIKPLYVLHHQSGGVTLSSVIPPLLLLPEARRIDPIGLAHYLAFGHTGPTLTMFEPISKLAPGSAWEWRRQEDGLWASSVRRLPTKRPEYEPMTLGQAVADSVGAHMVADVEVGVFLSGGTDSTLLAALAAEINPDLRTFTLSFPGAPDIDESERASANATLIGTKHETIPVYPKDMHEAARLVTSVQGEPFGDAAALPLAVLAREARREIKVALSGEGADELFGGYKRYRVSRWLQNPLFAATRQATKPLARMWAGRRGEKPGDRAVEALLWGGGVRSHAALLVGELNVLPESGPASEAGILARSDWAAAENGDGERVTARDFDLQRWLPNVYMEKTDRATMASGLEARVPYLDPAVAAVAENSVRHSFGKAALREELERRLSGVSLPEEKKGMAVPYEPLLGGLREHARRELRSRDSVLYRFLGADGVRALRARCARSVTTQYRVATVGLWDEVFSGTSFT